MARPAELALQDTTVTPRLTLPKLATIAAVVAVIYLAQDIILPLSIAVLITFALSPLATRLRKFGVPHLASVLMVVAIAFTAIGLFVLIVTSQLASLAQNLPTFQANIIAKVENLQDASSDNGMIAGISRMMTAINDEISTAVPAGGDAAETAAREPMPVEVVTDQSPIATLQDLVMPLVSPIATIGLVIVIVIFMLLEREDLRDRFIKLVGTNDLHRTTQVLQEAGRRVGQYLLVQLLVNLIYAVPIGLGLWLIGVPNATLWGLLTLVLRFVPYIGTVLAAAFPMFLAFAVSPDWSAILWTIALFGVVELITSNMIEPYLYGSRTGVSPLAIIVSAIFWTWLWGPLGLVLSTPLTVCLVVLGRHLPQFAVFDILFGDDPVLAPHARLYQRFLVGDMIEATSRAEEALESQYISEYYRDVGLPALLLAQHDHVRGVLTTDQKRNVASVAQTMVTDLEPVVAEELDEILADGGTLAGAGRCILCVGGRGDLDDAAAAMVTQALAAEGAVVTHHTHIDLAPSRFKAIDLSALDTIILTFLDTNPSRASLLHIRRIKQAAPHVRVGVLICEMPAVARDSNAKDFLVNLLPPVSDDTLQMATEIGADLAVNSLDGLLRVAFDRDAPVPLPAAKRPRRRHGTSIGAQAAVA